MILNLESLKPCLQGVVPSAIFTCSLDGIPNVSYLSQVHYLDSEHVALSCQYFHKTMKNILENPLCTVRILHPENVMTYRLLVQYQRSEIDGALFDEMALRLAAIADYSGASDLLKLKSIEIFKVLEIVEVSNEAAIANKDQPLLESAPRFTVTALQQACERVNASQTLEEVFDSILQAMDLDFGFRNSMILLTDESSHRLLTIATRGYEQNGVGAEVGIGDGVIGKAAETRTPLMHTSLARELIYARSVRDRAREQGLEDQIREAIPLPGLPESQCQIAIPLLIRSEVLGILFAESSQIFQFKESDEQILRTLGSVLAMAIRSLETVHRVEQEPAPAPLAKLTLSKPSHTLFSYFPQDECVFVNGEYLIRNIPAQILWKILNQYKKNGQVEFTNRELRMDASLKLPEIKDNLETRLILLRKRLEKKCPYIRIQPIGRGRFKLLISGELKLENAGS